MAKHTLTITVDATINNDPQRPNAGAALNGQMLGRVTKGFLQEAIKEYIRSPSSTVTKTWNNAPNIGVTITLTETP